MRSNLPTPAPLPSPHTPTTALSLWPWLTPVLAFLRRLWHVSLRSFVRWTAAPRANMAVPGLGRQTTRRLAAPWGGGLPCRAPGGGGLPFPRQQPHGAIPFRGEQE